MADDRIQWCLFVSGMKIRGYFNSKFTKGITTYQMLDKLHSCFSLASHLIQVSQVPWHSEGVQFLAWGYFLVTVAAWLFNISHLPFRFVGLLHQQLRTRVLAEPQHIFSVVT